MIDTYPRAVIKRWGSGISPGYYEHGPRLLSKENKIKIELIETPCCLIPRLILLREKFLQFDWLRAVVFLLN